MKTSLQLCSKLIVMGIALAATVALAQTAGSLPSLAGCAIFPADNIWNTRIDTLPVDPQSDAYIQSEGSASPLHPDFGTVYNGEPNGQPFVVVPANQPMVPVVFTAYGSESDPGPYPIPPDAPVQGGTNGTGDRHLIVLQSGTCQLYEMFLAYEQSDGSWQAASGAMFDLTNDGPLRPAGWTSADAAGLPTLPALVRYDEVQQALASDGVLHHALRFDLPNTRAQYVWPARHFASSSTSPAFPPMGQRFRLKASVNVDVYPGTNTPVSPTNKVILKTLQQYGMFVADNGASFFVSGAPDPRWNDSDLHSLLNYLASDFEAVDESSLQADPNSGAVRAATTASATYGGADSLTQGNWTGKYGADGQLIPNGITNIPSYATVTINGDSAFTWTSSTTDPRALQISGGSSSRIASAWESNSGSNQFTIDINLTDGNSHQVTLYLCDWDQLGRWEPINVIDAASGTVLDPETSWNFGGGVYATWTLKGHVQFQVIDGTGNHSVVNGIFFGG